MRKSVRYPSRYPSRKVVRRRPRARQIFNNLTIVWTQSTTNGNLRRNTSGFTAELRDLSGNVVDTATFDAFGTARFDNVPTPTGQTYQVRILDPNGTQVRGLRTVTQGSSGFAYIG